MQAPVDYPVPDEAVNHAQMGPMTYAALLERHDAQQHITVDMIRSATLSMEEAQQLPFANRPENIDTHFATRVSPEAVLSRLLKVIR